MRGRVLGYFRHAQAGRRQHLRSLRSRCQYVGSLRHSGTSRLKSRRLEQNWRCALHSASQWRSADGLYRDSRCRKAQSRLTHLDPNVAASSSRHEQRGFLGSNARQHHRRTRCTDFPTTWVYDITTDLWHPRNDLPVSVVDAQNEIGPALLRYDGTAFFLGSNQHTAIYNAAANPKWSNGPDLPDQNGLKIGIVDGPAALLVNGNVLFAAGATDDAGDWSSPCWFFEFDGSSFNRANDPPNYVSNTYATRLLLLPTGDVMFCRGG